MRLSVWHRVCVTMSCELADHRRPLLGGASMIATKPMTELSAADVMSRDVVTVPQTMLLHHAAHLLARKQISGAPVVDDSGRCVGILSATDFVRHVESGPEPVHVTHGRWFCADWQVVDLEMLPKDEV